MWFCSPHYKSSLCQVWWPYTLWKCKCTELTFMIWWPYFSSGSKKSLSRCRLTDHILCKWQLLRHYFEWVWVILDGWDIILGGGVWGIILGGWEWVGRMGKYFGWLGVGGGERGWMHCLIMPKCFLCFNRFYEQAFSWHNVSSVVFQGMIFVLS